MEHYEVDVLLKNSFGRSILTEAFQSQNTEVIELCLSHSSATEDRLISSTNTQDSPMDMSIDVLEGASMETNSADSYDTSNAVFHQMRFVTLQNVSTTTLKIRELPITRADNPFGTNTAPQDDTTGLGIWPASILAAHWVIQHR